MARILVIEDDPDLSFIYKTALTREGHDVVAAKHVREALVLLTNTSFDLIILDMNMPDAPGVRVIEFVRDDVRLRDIPIAVISANENWRERTEQLGVTRFLTKPVLMRDLLALVDDVTGAA
jgi:CheY-like chemotaxis protein